MKRRAACRKRVMPLSRHPKFRGNVLGVFVCAVHKRDESESEIYIQAYSVTGTSVSCSRFLTTSNGITQNCASAPAPAPHIRWSVLVVRRCETNQLKDGNPFSIRKPKKKKVKKSQQANFQEHLEPLVEAELESHQWDDFHQ